MKKKKSKKYYLITGLIAFFSPAILFILIIFIIGSLFNGLEKLSDSYTKTLDR